MTKHDPLSLLIELQRRARDEAPLSGAEFLKLSCTIKVSSWSGSASMD